MRQILSAAQMKKADASTINNHHIPSLVLMERAALAVVKYVPSYNCEDIVVVCGTGNNGADGVAIARILHLREYAVSVILVGSSEKYTAELIQQIEIAKSYGVDFVDSSDIDAKIKSASLIIDSIFGIGLSREVTGDFANMISLINSSPAMVISVDIPSGYSTDTGNELGIGVKADLTVTFSFVKKGLLLSNCHLNSGRIVCQDVGIFTDDTTDNDASKNTFQIEDLDLSLVPTRRSGANKGSMGKLLVIAGSQSIYGAAYLSARAAMEMGCGYVKVFTHQDNSVILKDKLPEAVCISYDTFDETDEANLLSATKWANAILIGPGLSTDDTARKILNTTLSNTSVPVLIDADALNIIGVASDILKNTSVPVVITPHLVEMKRLTGLEVDYIDKNMEEVATSYSAANNITVVLKNYVTYIAGITRNYINTSGTKALATAGSGDVLAGIISALLATGLDADISAALGAYIHGMAGKSAAGQKHSNNIIASEIVAGINDIVMLYY